MHYICPDCAQPSVLSSHARAAETTAVGMPRTSTTNSGQPPCRISSPASVLLPSPRCGRRARWCFQHIPRTWSLGPSKNVQDFLFCVGGEQLYPTFPTLCCYFGNSSFARQTSLHCTGIAVFSVHKNAFRYTMLAVGCRL